MCTVIDSAHVMVCDVSRDRVTDAVRERLGDAVSIETVHYEGTLFTCEDGGRMADFQRAVSDALEWEDDRFSASTTMPSGPEA